MKRLHLNLIAFAALALFASSVRPASAGQGVSGAVVNITGNFTTQGLWDSGTTYDAFDLVTDGSGNSWVSRVDNNTNHALPTLPTTYNSYWQLLAQKGATGATGSTGAAGADGADGDDGAAGQGVPAGGTAGQVLKKIDGTDYNTEWDDESGGGGVSTGDLFQGYVPALGVKCNSSSPSNVASAQVTVSVSGATATITSDTDVRPYIHKYAVIGTSGQSGKAAMVQTISGDGLTVTATNAGADNVLATDAVAAQLILYGQPYSQGGDATWGPASYTVQDPVTSGVINVVIRGGLWTGPMWTAGEWYTGGGATGIAVMADTNGPAKIYGISGHLLVTDAWYKTTLADNTTDQLIFTVDASVYEQADIEFIASEASTTNTNSVNNRYLFYDTTHLVGVGLAGALAQGDPGVTYGGGSGMNGTSFELKLTSTATGNSRTIWYRVSNLVKR